MTDDNDFDRYLAIRSGFGSGDDAFNWLVEQVRLVGNGEHADEYSMGRCARDLMFQTLIDVGGFTEDEAMEHVSAAGQMISEIRVDDDLGEHLVLAWQPDYAEFAETFVFALDLHEGAEDDDVEQATNDPR